MTQYGTCVYCHTLVQSPQTPAFEVRGWEYLRAGGGANAIRERTRIDGRIAHASCLPHLMRKERGVAEQETLFGGGA